MGISMRNPRFIGFSIAGGKKQPIPLNPNIGLQIQVPKKPRRILQEIGSIQRAVDVSPKDSDPSIRKPKVSKELGRPSPCSQH
jgi:hypothetical protein